MITCPNVSGGSLGGNCAAAWPCGWHTDPGILYNFQQRFPLHFQFSFYFMFLIENYHFENQDTPDLAKSYPILSVTWTSMRLMHLWLRYRSLSVLRFNTVNMFRIQFLLPDTRGFLKL